MCFTPRRDTRVRLTDYKNAFRRWIEDPETESIVLVENSGFELSDFEAIASSNPEKQVEILSFKCPPFDGSRGKGYGRCCVLSIALGHSKLVRASQRFLKVSGRYFVANSAALIRFLTNHAEVDVVCNFRSNLTWADSRAFGGSTRFLEQYLCPRKDQINDSERCWFEHVLARAVHQQLAESGTWSMTPEALEIVGVSATLERSWNRGHLGRLKQRLRHRLIIRSTEDTEL